MVIRDGMWLGESALIVGGGPSLRGFSFSRLAAWRSTGGRVVAVNKAGELFSADLHVGMDRTYWRSGAARSVSECRVQIDHGDKLADGPDVTIPCAAPRGTPNRHSALAWGRTLAEGVGCGNSGFAALNLADVLGADTVYLLGFDMKGEGGLVTHFHDGYAEKAPADSICDRWLAAFRWASTQVLARVVVLEVQPGDSRLDCFPKRLAREVL